MKDRGCLRHRLWEGDCHFLPREAHVKYALDWNNDIAKDHTAAHRTVKVFLDRRTHSRRLAGSDPAQLWLRNSQSLVGKERWLDTCRGLSLKLPVSERY